MNERLVRGVSAGLVIVSTVLSPFEVEAPGVVRTTKLEGAENDFLRGQMPKLVVAHNVNLTTDNFAVLRRSYRLSPISEAVAYVFVFSDDLGPVNLIVERNGYRISVDERIIAVLRKNVSSWGHSPDRETYLEIYENGEPIYGIIKIHNEWVIVEPLERLVLAEGSHALYPSEEVCLSSFIPLGEMRIYYEECELGRELDLGEFLRETGEIGNVVGANFDVWKNADEYVDVLRR